MNRRIPCIIGALLLGLAGGCNRSQPAGVPIRSAITTGVTGESPSDGEAVRHSALRPKTDVAGVGNFAQVSAALYRGAQPTAEGFHTLRNLGIKTVVNLRDLHDDHELMAGAAMKYVRIPCNAWHPEEKDVVAFLKVMADPANQPVFVHCQAGADRTGMMVAAYRMTVEGWTAEDAAAELPAFGFHEVFATILTHVKTFNVEKLRREAGIADPGTPGT